MQEEIYAYKTKCDNFAKLKKGLEKKFVNDELNLEDRQQKSVLKLCDTPSDDYSLSSGYFHACTAFGKTYLMMAIAEGYRSEEPNKKIIILEESTKVLEQVKKDFTNKTSFSTSDIGAYYGKEKSPESPIITCTYSSMEKLVKEVGAENIGLVLCDEAHHILSENRRRVAEAFSGSCLYGFTATPEYNADKECASVFGTEIDKVSLSEGIREELLCGFKNGIIVSKIPVDLTEAKTSGDYDGDKLAEILNQSHIHGMREELAKFYLEGVDDTIGKIKGKPTIINAPNQAEADKLAKAFNRQAGTLIAKAYHTNSGELPLEEFNNGEFPVLIQVNRVTEGYSNPKVEVCINYPTASRVRSAQRGGRALRRDKDNPHKVALVMDICFMKDASSSPLEGAYANGQVLFMDIAGDAGMFPPSYLPHTQTTNQTSSQKSNQNITELQLFDIITNYDNLLEMYADEMENDEKNAPKRDKLPTDLIQRGFVRFSIQQNGQTMDWKAKSDLYKKLSDTPSLQEQGVFLKVKAGSGQVCSVVPEDKLPELKAYLQERGYEFIDHEYKRNKLPTDLDQRDFKKFRIQQNGKTVDEKAKYDLYKKLSDIPSLQEQGVFLKVKAGPKVCSVVPEDKLPALKAYLQEQGYEFIDRDKLSTDWDMVDFMRFSIQQKGKPINPKAKFDLYKKLSNTLSLQAQGVFRKVKSGNMFCSVVPEDKLPELKAYLQERGYEFIDHEYKRNKLPTDLDQRNFKKFRIQQNGKNVDEKAKSDLYNELSADQSLQEQGVFLKAKAGPKVCSVVPGDKLPALRAYLQEQGYEIQTPFDRYLAAEKEVATAQTKEEKKKHLKKMKQVFYLAHPEAKKKNFCSGCLEKINKGR